MRLHRRRPFSRVIAAATLLAAATAAGASFAAAPARDFPAPLIDEMPDAASEVAVLAGGCFWGVQGVFQHVDGVSSAVSGYTGGEAATAQYETVSGGRTGHAESVQITFDPKKISYGRILQIFFSVVHDPTELNYQGPDHGSQYRSEVFAQSADQEKVAKRYIQELNQARVFNAAIVTKVESDKTFYPAEDYHHDFLTNYPSYPYIVINDLPKVAALKQQFPALYRAEPVLVHPKSD